MKMLFSPRDGSLVKEVKKILSEAGIRCEVRHTHLTQGAFDVPAAPELLIEDERDILKALKLVGGRRLREMTVIFPTQ